MKPYYPPKPLHHTPSSLDRPIRMQLPSTVVSTSLSSSSSPVKKRGIPKQIDISTSRNSPSPSRSYRSSSSSTTKSSSTSSSSSFKKEKIQPPSYRMKKKPANTNRTHDYHHRRRIRGILKHNNNNEEGDSLHKKQNKSIRSLKKKQREHIVFEDYDTIFHVLHVKDMSQEEKHDCWITSKELREIRQSCIGTVRSLNDTENGKPPPEGIFLRGLDQHSDKYRERKDEINNQIYEAVYRIQEFQKLTGKDVTDIMAKLCTKYSEPSVIAAHTTAISDIFAAHRNVWCQKSIPNAAVFEDSPKGQGTYNY